MVITSRTPGVPVVNVAAAMFSGIVVLAGLGLAGCGAATGGEQQDLTPITSSANPSTRIAEPPAAPGQGSPQSYSKGLYSIQLTLHNNTGQTLYLDPERTVHNTGAHWAQQAQAALPNNSQQTVTAYTDVPTGMGLAVTYTLADGEYATASVANYPILPNAFSSGIVTGWNSKQSTYLFPDPNYPQNDGQVSSGTHATADVTFIPS